MTQQAANVVPLAVVFGLILGSFLNVVALRWYAGRGLQAANRSQCPHCKHLLRWYELLPLLSYLVQAGRCRTCGRRLSLRYPGVELLTGIIFGLVVAAYGLQGTSLILLVLSAVLVVSLLVDLEHLILPDQLTALALVVSMLGLLLLRQPNLVGLSVNVSWGSWWVGALVGGGFLGALYLLTRGRGMGLGDVKLAAVLGTSVGGIGIVVALGFAFVAGALIGVALLGTRQAGWKTEVPFGPFLIAGWWVSIFWGAELARWYTSL